MSLVMMALRICAVEAIKSAGTLVGDNVLNSKISAIDTSGDGALSSDEERPFIAVYTDAAKSPEDEAATYRVNGFVTLTMNFGVSLAMSQTDKETGDTVVVMGVPATDAAFEATLDTIACQIWRGLSAEGNAWAEMFRQLVQSIEAKVQIRQSSANDGARLACGQMRLTLQVVPDPLGVTPEQGSIWHRFLDLLRFKGADELALFEALLTGESVGLYPRYIERTGMSFRDATTLGLYPAPGANRSTTIASVTSDAEPAA